MQRLIWIFWPSFIVGGVGESVFFTVFDPADLVLLGHPLAGVSRTAVYSIGFFAFWLFAAASSGMTCFLQRTSTEVNRCEVAPRKRPEGCPNREQG